VKKLLTIGLIILLLTSVWLPTAYAEEEDEEEASIDMSELQPSLVIESIQVDEAIAGGEFYLSMVVRNMGNGPALNVTLDLDVLDHDDNPFSFKDGPPELTKLDKDESTTITVALKVAADTVSRDYRLRISVLSNNALYESAPRATAIITVPVKYDLTKPELLVSTVRFDPSEPKAGETFTAYFFLENISRVDAHNVVLTLNGLDNFTVEDVSNKKALTRPIAGGTTSSGIGFTLSPKDTRTGNNVELKITYAYLGNQREEQTETLNLPLAAETGTRPRLELTNFTTRQSIPGREFVLSFTLTNHGERAAQDIKLNLDGNNSILPLNTSTVSEIAPLAGGESRIFEYTMGLNRSDTTVYPMTIGLEYSDRSGRKYNLERTFGLTSAEIGATGSNPWVIISKYKLNPEKVYGGSVLNLSLDIENTNQKPVHNVKISLGVEMLEGERGDTVFSPIDSSNSFYIDSIPGKQVVTQKIDLFVDPNANARTYIVPVNINYEDDSGNPIAVEELVTIPVTQESRLQVISVDVPHMTFTSQPVPVGAEFVNVGKVTLSNFIVTLEGDFPKENASYFVGTLEPGMSDYFQGLVIPQQPEPVEGKIVFSYIDNNNQEVRQEEPFTIDVQEMPKEMMEGPGGPGVMPGERPPGGFPGNGGTGSKMSAGWIALLLLALAAGGFIYWKKKKARQKSEELFYE
jgi:hypothetical protein